MPERLVNIQEISRMLSVKEKTIYSWVSQGIIPYYKIGRLVRFDRKEILEWIRNYHIKGRRTKIFGKDYLYNISR